MKCIVYKGSRHYTSLEEFVKGGEFSLINYEYNNRNRLNKRLKYSIKHNKEQNLFSILFRLYSDYKLPYATRPETNQSVINIAILESDCLFDVDQFVEKCMQYITLSRKEHEKFFQKKY